MPSTSPALITQVRSSRDVWETNTPKRVTMIRDERLQRSPPISPKTIQDNTNNAGLPWRTDILGPDKDSKVEINIPAACTRSNSNGSGATTLAPSQSPERSTSKPGWLPFKFMERNEEPEMRKTTEPPARTLRSRKVVKGVRAIIKRKTHTMTEPDDLVIYDCTNEFEEAKEQERRETERAAAGIFPIQDMQIIRKRRKEAAKRGKSSKRNREPDDEGVRTSGLAETGMGQGASDLGERKPPAKRRKR